MIDLLLRLRTFILLFVLLAISSFVMANANRPLMRGIRAQTLKIVGAVEYRISWAAEIPRSLRENQQLRGFQSTFDERTQSLTDCRARE